MPNYPISNHPLVGTEHTYRPWLPPYDPDTDDTEGGRLILAHGWTVKVRAVFANWNGVPGLDMLAVWVHATSVTTHVTPRDLGMVPLVGVWNDSPDDGEVHGIGDCAWWDQPRHYRDWSGTDCCGPRATALVGDGGMGVLCEEHFNLYNAAVYSSLVGNDRV